MDSKITIFRALMVFFFTSTLLAQSNCDILCPNDFTVIANDNGEYVVPNYFENNTVTLDDECDPDAAITQSPPPGTVVGLGEFEVTMTVSFAGEDDDCDFDVNVVADQGGDCDFDCPDDQVVTADDNGEFVIPDYATNGVLEISGDCGEFTSDQDPAAGTTVVAGTYVISLSAVSEDGNSSISCEFDLTVDETLSTSNFTENTFSMAPNPADTDIFFSEKIDNLKIYSLAGELINELDQVNTLNVNDLSTGVYIVKITKNFKTITKKLVVK